MAEIPRLLMLVGAATPPGRLAAAIAAAAEAVRGDAGDIDVDVMNLAETAIDTCDGRPLDGYGAETRRAVDRIGAAAAVLIAAPVYRASFPGVLKNLRDIVPVGALQGKPVGIAAMGGSAHHYLAVDMQLRQVLGWFGALVAPTSVYITGADFRDGALTSEAAREDLVALAETLVMLLRRLEPTLLGPMPLTAKLTGGKRRRPGAPLTISGAMTNHRDRLPRLRSVRRGVRAGLAGAAESATGKSKNYAFFDHPAV